MITLHAASELVTHGRPVCLAIGTFDGLHLGHRKIIRQTIDDARQQNALAVVVTFDVHPNRVVAPDKAPLLIQSLPLKLRSIAALQPDATLLLHFDEALSRRTGEQFIRELARDLGRLHSVCVGSDFHFGYKRSGNVAVLKTLGDELGFIVHGLEAVSLDGQAIRSTRIRQAIQAGHLDAASRMLGRPYALAGTVMRGDQIGRQLGFPTANLEVTGLVLPPFGVYAVQALLAGQQYPAVLNIGVRPTLNNPAPQLRVEAHLLDFGGDLYGQELELTFLSRIRGEQKFGALAELQAQIVQDIETARVLFTAR